MSKDKRVDAYIADAAPFARPILQHLRKVVHATCPEVEESIKWSSPAFLYQGKLFCSFAAFKEHAVFGFWHQGMEKLATKEVGKTYDAMGLLGRLTSLDDLPPDKTLVRYLKFAQKLHDSGEAARPKPKPRPALAEPADLTDALKRNSRAAAAWSTFSPSCRREYIEWITEAKRPETREQRLLTTVEWTAEGKSRHWKYKNC
ncbi:MAG TPA: YdeI/OmpD-associated family protein [Lacunisphaera sp.]|nr:YdeI/OmpD-associated family protein [Lacunisphaera sp.]